jgi:hypothetical protein
MQPPERVEVIEDGSRDLVGHVSDTRGLVTTTARTPNVRTSDECMKAAVQFSLGFMNPAPRFRSAAQVHFRAPGASGLLALRIRTPAAATLTSRIGWGRD